MSKQVRNHIIAGDFLKTLRLSLKILYLAPFQQCKTLRELTQRVNEKISDKNFKIGEKTCKKRKKTQKSEFFVSMATTQN